MTREGKVRASVWYSVAIAAIILVGLIAIFQVYPASRPGVPHGMPAIGAASLAAKELENIATASTHNESMSLRGRVVDQFGLPVIGAQVCLKYSGFYAGEMLGGHKLMEHELARTTGADGAFDVYLQGYMLELIRIEREGYYYTPFPRGVYQLCYDRGRPMPPPADPAHPTPFVMWKYVEPPIALWDLNVDRLGGRVLTFPSTLSFYLVPKDGKPSPHAAEGKRDDADIWVTVTRGAIRPFSQSYVFDWSVEIAAPSGGLVQTKDPYPFLAPAAGYGNNFRIVGNPSNPLWTHICEEDFYISCRGKFGRVQVRIVTSTDSIVALSGVVNLDGSRNLQPGGGYLNH